jgi:hypothetical protein
VAGAVERLRHDRMANSAVSMNDHRYGFAAAMVTLLAVCNAYLDRATDTVGHRQGILAHRGESADLVDDVVALLATCRGNQPTPDRSAYLLSMIMFPPVNHPAAERSPQERLEHRGSVGQVG